VFGENFDGDGAIQARVARAIDLTHSTGTDGGDDFIRSETRAGGQIHPGMSAF
jgi:hypothetical protein